MQVGKIEQLSGGNKYPRAIAAANATLAQESKKLRRAMAELPSEEIIGSLEWRAKHERPIQSDGGSTSYYELPKGATELNDLIEHKGMSFALGNIFKACYRFGEKDAASRLYDLNKIIYFAERLKAQEERWQ